MGLFTPRSREEQAYLFKFFHIKSSKTTMWSGFADAFGWEVTKKLEETRDFGRKTKKKGDSDESPFWSEWNIALSSACTPAE